MSLSLSSQQEAINTVAGLGGAPTGDGPKIRNKGACNQSDETTRPASDRD
jgi:hypothetical protein